MEPQILAKIGFILLFSAICWCSSFAATDLNPYSEGGQRPIGKQKLIPRLLLLADPWQPKQTGCQS